MPRLSKYYLQINNGDDDLTSQLKKGKGLDTSEKNILEYQQTHENMCLREAQIKITRYHFTFIRRAKVKKQ